MPCAVEFGKTGRPRNNLNPSGEKLERVRNIARNARNSVVSIETLLHNYNPGRKKTVGFAALATKPGEICGPGFRQCVPASLRADLRAAHGAETFHRRPTCASRNACASWIRGRFCGSAVPAAQLDERNDGQVPLRNLTRSSAVAASGSSGANSRKRSRWLFASALASSLT